MRRKVEFNNIRAAAIVIMLVITLAMAVFKIQNQKSELLESEAKVSVLTGYLADFTKALPLNNAQWWKQGCETSLDDLMEQIGDGESYLKVQVFALKIGCAAKANEVEKEFTKKLYDEAHSE